VLIVYSNKMGSKPSKERKKSERVPVKNPKPTDLRFMSPKARAVIQAKALQLYEECGDKSKVSREMGVPRSTLRRWLKNAGVTDPLKIDATVLDTNPDESESDKQLKFLEAAHEAEQDEQATADKDLIESLSGQEKRDIIRVAQILSRDEEMEVIENVSEGEVTVQNQYQSYTANLGMRILRDSKSRIRGPKTIKEFSELDNVIRRNLGLSSNGKGGTGSAGSALHVDVKILNGGGIPGQAEPVVEVNPSPSNG
jgi:transposase-like protein